MQFASTNKGTSEKSIIFGNPSPTDSSLQEIESEHNDYVDNPLVWGGYTSETGQDANKNGIHRLGAIKFSFVSTKGQFEPSIGYQISMLLTGLWWLLFSFIPFKHLKSRPGPPIPDDVNMAIYKIYITILFLP